MAKKKEDGTEVEAAVGTLPEIKGLMPNGDYFYVGVDGVPGCPYLIYTESGESSQAWDNFKRTLGITSTVKEVKISMVPRHLIDEDELRYCDPEFSIPETRVQQRLRTAKGKHSAPVRRP